MVQAVNADVGKRATGGFRGRDTVRFRGHGFGPRTEENQPPGEFAPTGKFGRMFPSLRGLVPSEEDLRELGAAMVEQDPGSAAGNNTTVPQGYTYLGQFIDHDVTFDPTALQEILVDPLALQNFRTPMLDLDSVYGSGPAAQPYLYDIRDPDKFLIGTTNQEPGRGDPNILPNLPHDLPRAPSGLGLLGDPRNDENLIVAQLHLAFLKFHNKIVDGLRGESDESITQISPLRKSIFEEARDLAIWHYQWIVLHDFLRRILDTEQLDLVLQEGPSFFNISVGKGPSDGHRSHPHAAHPTPFIPVEFSAAAYRLGHSMVRNVYDYNRVFTPLSDDDRIPPATLQLLFNFTAKSTELFEDDGVTPRDLPVPIPSDWIIDWRRFFEIDPIQVPVGFSRRLDPFLAPALTGTGENQGVPNVPEPNELALRNLFRGASLALPPGQSIARFMGLRPLDKAEIARGPDGQVAERLGFHVESPLWYYVLKEAEVRGGGQHLGEVGSRIIAEVFVGILLADTSSFLVRNPNWKPTLPAQHPETFTMVDLLKFVNDISPIDRRENVKDQNLLIPELIIDP